MHNVFELDSPYVPLKQYPLRQIWVPKCILGEWQIYTIKMLVVLKRYGILFWNVIPLTLYKNRAFLRAWLVCKPPSIYKISIYVYGIKLN